MNINMNKKEKMIGKALDNLFNTNCLNFIRISIIDKMIRKNESEINNAIIYLGFLHRLILSLCKNNIRNERILSKINYEYYINKCFDYEWITPGKQFFSLLSIPYFSQECQILDDTIKMLLWIINNNKDTDMTIIINNIINLIDEKMLKSSSKTHYSSQLFCNSDNKIKHQERILRLNAYSLIKIMVDYYLLDERFYQTYEDMMINNNDVSAYINFIDEYDNVDMVKASNFIAKNGNLTDIERLKDIIKQKEDKKEKVFLELIKTLSPEKQISEYEEKAIKLASPEVSYYYITNVPGANIEAHKEIINNSGNKDYIEALKNLDSINKNANAYMKIRSIEGSKNK